MRFLEAASASNPEDGLLLAEIASLKRNAGDLQAAEALSERATALAPEKADAWLSRGLALGALGRSVEAAQAFERAVQLDPRNADAWFYAAALDLQRGNAVQASRGLDRVQELDPKRPGLREAMAMARSTRPKATPKAPPPPFGSIRLLMVRCRTRSEAAGVLLQVSAGKDFSAIARSSSTDPSAAAGGDLGWVLPGDLRPPLNTAAKGLVPGAVSPILEVQDGFVVLKRIP